MKTFRQLKAMMGSRKDGKPYKLDGARFARAYGSGLVFTNSVFEKVRRDHAFDRRRVRSRGRMLTATGLPAFPR